MFAPRFRPYLLAGAFLVASGLMVLAYLAFGTGSSSSRLSKDLSAEFAPLPLSAEDLYLPLEPEIIPGTIPFRARRQVWKRTDAAPFWTDPAQLDQAPLRAAASAEVDALLDHLR